MPKTEMISAESPQPEVQNAKRSAGYSPKLVFLVLLVYFAGQLIARVCISGTLESDEAEQAILTQRWQWGYGPQGPLFTWLQILVFKVFGVSVFGLSLLKNSLLLTLFAFIWLSARQLTNSDSRATVATALLMVVPEIAWEFQRDLSHSVLLAALCAITFYILVRLLREGSPKYFVLLGIAAGLGMLSKYNYALFLFSILCAGVTIPLLRRKLMRPGLMLSAALMVAIAAPHAIWVATHKNLALASVSKLEVAVKGSWITAVAKGSWDLAIAFGSQVGILFAILSLVWWCSRGQVAEENSQTVWTRLLGRQCLITLAMCILAVLVFKVTNFKSRWIAPLVITLPACGIALLGQRLTRQWEKGIVWIGAAAAAVVLVLMPGHIYLANPLDRPFNWNAPMDILARKCKEQVAQANTIVAEKALVGGNFRLEFPDKPLILPDVPGLGIEPRSPVLLVWNATKSPEPPYKIYMYGLKLTGRDIRKRPAEFVEAAYKADEERKMRLGLILVRDIETKPQ